MDELAMCPCGLAMYAIGVEDNPDTWTWLCKDCDDDPVTTTVAEMAGLFEGGPDSVEWLRDQRSR